MVTGVDNTSCYTVHYDSPDWDWRKEISEDDKTDKECMQKPEIKA